MKFLCQEKFLIQFVFEINVRNILLFRKTVFTFLNKFEFVTINDKY